MTNFVRDVQCTASGGDLSLASPGSLPPGPVGLVPSSLLRGSLLQVFLALAVMGAMPLQAAEARVEHRSLGDSRVEWPGWDRVVRVISLRDYNTRVVAAGTLMLGVAAGMVGVFMLLRRRSLVGDVISHASLPGIALTFILLETVSPGTGKSLPALLLGALASGLLGVGCTTFILRFSRIKEDAALAIVLSVFFGFGVALMTIVQKIPTGNAAGLHHFIYGKAASMVAADVWWIGGIAVVAGLVFTAFFKEFTLLSFDESFASSQGWPTLTLDLTLLTLVTVVTVIALQSVGMLLAVAMLVIPSAAARFWTNNLSKMTILAAVIGGLGAIIGVFCSALFPRLAAGAVIVLAGSALFTMSMLLGAERGIIVRAVHRWRLQAHVGRDHLLRALFERIEDRLASRDELADAIRSTNVSLDHLLGARTWSSTELGRLLRRAEREELVVPMGTGFRLTAKGAEAARRVVRNHRLWELYLIEHADIAPSHVDRDADLIEHSIGPEVVAELEEILAERVAAVPPSPH